MDREGEREKKEGGRLTDLTLSLPVRKRTRVHQTGARLTHSETEIRQKKVNTELRVVKMHLVRYVLQNSKHCLNIPGNCCLWVCLFLKISAPGILPAQPHSVAYPCVSFPGEFYLHFLFCSFLIESLLFIYSSALMYGCLKVGESRHSRITIIGGTGR